MDCFQCIFMSAVLTSSMLDFQPLRLKGIIVSYYFQFFFLVAASLLFR